MTDPVIVGFANPDGTGEGNWTRTIDEVPWDGPAGPVPAELHTAPPVKCRHPRHERVRLEQLRVDGSPEMIETCGRCGHLFDRAMQRRGRAVRKFGKAAELRDARQMGLEPRGTSRDPEDSGGAMDPVVLQSKTGPGHASAAWIRELEALAGVAHNRPRILLATEKPGHGKKARRLVVMFEEEFQAATGLDARRRILEQLVDDVKFYFDSARGPHDFEEAEKKILETLDELDTRPRR